jgi:putative spermidine/putrescine transport system substrate-binding protein
MTFASDGGAYQTAEDNAWLKPYAALTGITFQEDPTASEAKIMSQVQAGQVQWDVVDMSSDFGLG